MRRTLGETIQVSAELEEGLPEVLIDPIQLETALLNVALNSRDAMPDGGSLVVRTLARSLGEEEAKGGGLGLSMVHGFARQARGAVVVRSTLGAGPAVELYLPARAAAALPAPP